MNELNVTLSDDSINVEIQEVESINTNVPDLNYIPAYKEYEEERQENELVRQSNESTRESNETERIGYYEEIKAEVEAGDFNGEDGKNTVYVGSETPVDDYYNVWIDENGDISTIPTKTSDLTNDSGFITSADIPSIPSKTSDLTNDSGFIDKDVNNLTSYTKTSDLSNVATSGSYNDLTNKPTIPTVPTNLSSFTDDLGSSPTHTHSQYLTSHQDITGKEDKSNKVTSISSSSTDTQYPSAKCVYDATQNIISTIEELSGTVLYNNATGTQGTVTLSETSANFNYIEIFAVSNGNNVSTKVYSPNGKHVAIPCNYISNGTALVYLVNDFSISGTSISPVTSNCGYFTVSTSSIANFTKDGVNYLYITRVVGYK